MQIFGTILVRFQQSLFVFKDLGVFQFSRTKQNTFELTSQSNKFWRSYLVSVSKTFPKGGGKAKGKMSGKLKFLPKKWLFRLWGKSVFHCFWSRDIIFRQKRNFHPLKHFPWQLFIRKTQKQKLSFVKTSLFVCLSVRFILTILAGWKVHTDDWVFFEVKLAFEHKVEVTEMLKSWELKSYIKSLKGKRTKSKHLNSNFCTFYKSQQSLTKFYPSEKLTFYLKKVEENKTISKFHYRNLFCVTPNEQFFWLDFIWKMFHR